MKIINAIRSILFNLLFAVTMTIGCLIMFPLCFVKSDKPVRSVLGATIRVVLFWARWIMGIRQEVVGAEKLPPIGEPVILVSKHASNMDPYLTWQARADVTALAKKELFNIPIMGRVFHKIDAVRIDRAAGNAHKGLDDAASEIIRKGMALIVYPEATRVLPGERRKLKPGAWHLQKGHDLPCYPVAFNTGCHWVKGFWHKPGKVMLEIGDRFPSGLSREEFLALTEETVVRRSNEIMVENGAELPTFEEQPVISRKTAARK